MRNPFEFFLPKRFLGVDIGTSFVKIVELSKFGHRRKLENYGALPASILYQKPFRTFEKSTLLLSSSDIARAITAVLEEAKMKTRQCIFSIPDFSTFFTSFELPLMSKEELPQAVKYEARKYIPLSLAEVTLDWQTIGGTTAAEKKTELEILLAAVPNEIINQYRSIAKISQLELFALEAEVFGLAKSLVGEEERRVLAIIDSGAQTTTCSIIDKRVLKRSHTIDLAGNDFTATIAKSLSIDYREAENLKKTQGLLGLQDILSPLVDFIFREIERIFQDFSLSQRKEIEKIILAGESALLPGLKEYFQERFKIEVEIANPFANILYPPILEKTLKELGPGYAVAVGLALRGLE